MRFLGAVRSLFYQNSSSARKKKNEKKKKIENKDITFTKKVWKPIVPEGNTVLFLTGHNSGTKNRSDERFSVFYSS